MRLTKIEKDRMSYLKNSARGWIGEDPNRLGVETVAVLLDKSTLKDRPCVIQIDYPSCPPNIMFRLEDFGWCDLNIFPSGIEIYRISLEKFFAYSRNTRSKEWCGEIIQKVRNIILHGIVLSSVLSEEDTTTHKKIIPHLMKIEEFYRQKEFTSFLENLSK